MEGIQSCGTARGCALDPPDSRFQQTTTRLSALSVSAEQSADITILTDEGDTVMLSSREYAEAELLTYEHFSATHLGYDREETQQVDFEAGSELALFVQGDLNDQEMADIQSLLSDLGAMLKAFLIGAGEHGGSTEAAGELDRFETISAFKADFEYRVSARYLNLEDEQLTLQAAGEAEPAALTESEPDAAATEVPSPATTPAAVAAGQADVPIEASIREADQTAARMAKRVHESGLSGHRRLKHLKKFMKNFLEQFLTSQTVDAKQVQRGQNVIERFMDEIKTSGAAVEIRVSRAAFNLQFASQAYQATDRASTEPAVVESA
ncbi:MAG: hypothetical protein MUC57_02765 [Desulfobacterales bacterium]|jgi:hypothetical protein|nr:hypothetical protein [Desulfobacterales bacterium]